MHLFFEVVGFTVVCMAGFSAFIWACWYWSHRERFLRRARK